MIVHLFAEVTGVDVGRDLSYVLLCGQHSSGEFVETQWFGAGQLDHAVDRCTHGDVGQGGGDVLRRDRLHQDRWQAHRVANRAAIRNAADELEELRCAENGVGDCSCLYRRLLGDLCAHVPTVGHTVGQGKRI